MSQPAIAVDGLTKSFGRVRALDGVSFEVPHRSVFGFLGPNGAGKTTATRILLGLARADGGSARILGEDVLADFQAVAPRIGFVPDVPSFYPWMRAPEFLDFASSLLGLDRRTAAQRSQLLLELVGLKGVDNQIGGYSRGMKQRLGIAQALLNSPEVLILDEPTSALDPLGRHEVLELMSTLRDRATVFFSTHVLSDVERVCDRVAVLDHGRVVAADTTAALRERYGGARQLRIVVDTREDELRAAFEREPWLVELSSEPPSRTREAGYLLTVSDHPAAALRIPAVLAEQRWALRRLEPVEASLEDVFVELVSRPEVRR
ncbi:MAG TPA: ABC transporter ATP-binding protein [Actinomycetales bacterium]|nr:ABC transporter ATP-binding protein [Actinomycetales bacterium]